jgi:ParB/RepB/Spo0J family partition protein
MVKLETEVISIDEIYVPAKRRGTLDEAKVEELAESIIEDGQKTPIHVRRDDAKKRYVLVEGMHRLEALKALGEATIDALIVMARRS